MSNITRLDQFKKQQLQKKNRAHTLCKSGFHHWDIIHKNHFDIKKGQLVTTRQCRFCKKIKVSAR